MANYGLAASLQTQGRGGSSFFLNTIEIHCIRNDKNITFLAFICIETRTYGYSVALVVKSIEDYELYA